MELVRTARTKAESGHVFASKTERYDFATVIAHQMKFESMTPSHCSLSIRSHSLENLVGIAAQVVTHGLANDPK